MLDSIHGKVLELAVDAVVVDLGAVALRLRVSSNTAQTLRLGETTRLRCHLRLREDDVSMYGFARSDERLVFETLLAVSGLGPEKALALLSAMSPEGVARAIEDRDTKRFRTVRGIGDKLAQRIVLELAGKLDGLSRASGAPLPPGVDRATHRDLVATLSHLGYPKATAEASADVALRMGGADATLEDLVKIALRGLLAGKPSSSGEA